MFPTTQSSYEELTPVLSFLLMQQTELPTGNNHIISKCNVWLKKRYIVRSSPPNSFTGLFWWIASCLSDANFVRHSVEGKLPGQRDSYGWIKHVGKPSHISPRAVPLGFVSQHVDKWKHISSESSELSLCVTYMLKDLASFARSQKGTHWDHAPILSLVMQTATPPTPIKLHVSPLKWCRRDRRPFRAWHIYNVFQIEGTVLYCTSSAVI